MGPFHDLNLIFFSSRSICGDRADFCLMITFTDGKIPWTGDQLVARPLTEYRTTQTQNKRIRTPNIHVLSEIRTHDLVSERAKRIYALDRSATVTGLI
jgi:hypothetical protein